MMLLYTLAAVLFIGGLLFQAFRPQLTGWLGEMLLHRYLCFKLDKNKYIVMHDIYLPTEEGTTTQIDHIVVSQWGIFVIETKTYSGWIAGKEKEAEWTVKYHYHGKSHKIQNPLRQNYKHIATLAECLGIGQEYFKTVIAVAATAKFGKTMPPGVVYFGEVDKFLKENSQTTIIPPEQIQEVADTILAWQATLPHSQKSAHVENLRKTHPPQRASHTQSETPPEAPKQSEQPPSSIEAPSCPRCGKPMVLRTTKKDGSHFWGCPAYPKCRGMVKF